MYEYVSKNYTNIWQSLMVLFFEKGESVVSTGVCTSLHDMHVYINNIHNSR